jgi:hypothetical protein
MCGSVLKSAYVFFIAVSLSALAPVTCLAQVQEGPTPSRSAARIPDAPSALARISDSQVTLNVFANGSSLNLMPEPGEYESWVSSFRNRIQDRPNLSQPAMRTDNRMDGVSLMFSPVYGRIHPKTIPSADDWQYYGRHIPVAGPLVLRVGEEAQAHPRVLALFKMIQPQF